VGVAERRALGIIGLLQSSSPNQLPRSSALISTPRQNTKMTRVTISVFILFGTFFFNRSGIQFIDIRPELNFPVGVPFYRNEV